MNLRIVPHSEHERSDLLIPVVKNQDTHRRMKGFFLLGESDAENKGTQENMSAITKRQTHDPSVWFFKPIKKRDNQTIEGQK